MAFGAFGLIVCCLAALFVYLWKTSHTFRYYAKYCYFYGDIQFAAFLVLLPSLFRPKDPANIRLFQQWCNATFKVLGVTVEKRNTEHLENVEEPAILLVNHQNTVDVIGLMQVAPYRSTYLAKKEIMYLGYFGLSGWLSGLVFIDRLNPEKALGTMRNVAKIIQEKKIKLWVFPEGTRNLNGTMLPFKKGAFHLAIQAQVPIYPLVLSSYQHFLDPKRKIFNTGKVIASALPRIETKGLTTDDVNTLLNKVHDLMEAEFKKISKEVEEEAKLKGCSLLVK